MSQSYQQPSVKSSNNKKKRIIVKIVPSRSAKQQDLLNSVLYLLTSDAKDCGLENEARAIAERLNRKAVNYDQ